MSEVKVDILEQTSESWDGVALPAYPTGAPQITILKYTFPPQVPLQKHRHDIINCGLLLKGELTIVGENGLERTFHAGEPLVEMCGTVHYGINRGTEPAELLMMYVGTEGMKLKEVVEE